MKKLIYTLFIVITSFLFNSITTKAEKGTCIIQQLSNTYEVETPFYWYEATKENTVSSMLKESITYNHTSTYIDTSTKCNQINKSLPKYEKDDQNILNYTITTYYFSKSKITDSQTIYNKATSLFQHSPSSSDLTIKSTFISLDNLPPIITSENLNPTIITSLEETISVVFLQMKITAYDEVDGLIATKVYEDNYTKNCKVLGNHTVTFSASDTSNNTSYFTITIKVEDKTKPTISGNKNLKSNMSNPLTIKQIKDTLTVKDNYYEINNSSITLFKDNFTGKEQTEGTFTVSFKVSDPSNNISDEFIVNINTYDDIPPSIKGESSYEISNKTLLNIQEISSKLIATDNIDDNPSIELINDSYSGNYYKIGLYQISFIAKDKNDNTSSPYIININVKDTTKPTIYVSQKFIGVDGNANINIEDIIEIIEESNNIDSTNVYSKTIIKDEYTNNKNIPGEYDIQLNYELKNGESMNIETIVIVEDFSPNTNKEEKSAPKKSSFWNAIKNFFIKLWNFIKYIFSFKWIKKLI